jgi:hypothetical protein
MRYESKEILRISLSQRVIETFTVSLGGNRFPESTLCRAVSNHVGAGHFLASVAGTGLVSMCGHSARVLMPYRRLQR